MSEEIKFDFLYGAEKYPRFNYEQALLGFVKNREIFGGNVNYFLGIWDCDDLNCWIERKEIKQNCFEEGKKLLKPKFFEDYMKESAKFRKKCKAFHRKMWLASHIELSDSELLKLLDEMANNIRLALVYFRGSRPEYTAPVEQELQLALEKKTEDMQKLANWTMTLVTPEELDDIKQEELAWNSLVLSEHREHDFDVRRALFEHLFQYSWLYPEQLELAGPIKEMEERLSSDDRTADEIKKERASILDKHKVFIEERRAVLRELNDDRVVFLSDVLSRSALERMELKACWSGIATICHTLWEELAKRTGENKEKLLVYYMMDDVIRAVREGKLLTDDEIEQRRDFTLVCLKYPDFTVEHGQEARVKADRILAETLKELDTDELSGQVASPGKVRGTARLVAFDVEGQREAAKVFKKGDILVTKMTQPNMVSLAHLAAAIVTDEGGITSHAAVISREFNIPCVVGTKLATKIIKDGDEVEVNADKGVVTILENR